jgi:hypothetical protein
MNLPNVFVESMPRIGTEFSGADAKRRRNAELGLPQGMSLGIFHHETMGDHENIMGEITNYIGR